MRNSKHRVPKEGFYAFSTTPPSPAMEQLQSPCVPQDLLLSLDYIYMSSSHYRPATLQTQNSEQDLHYPHRFRPLPSLPTLNIHARAFVPGAREHSPETSLNVHAAEFVPGSRHNNPSTSPSEMGGLGAAFPPTDQQYPHIDSPMKAEYEEQAREGRESARRFFVQYMHDADKGIQDEDVEGDSFRVITDPQSDYQWFECEELQTLKCVHHFNVFGRPVLTKSGTAPATTIAILKSAPKHLNVTTPNGLWKTTVMECAQQLLDPVCYYGESEILECLRGSELENACIGQCEKIYSQHGWWVHDHYGPEEYHIVADPLDPWSYPDPAETIMINGITESFAHRVDIITAATQEKEAEDAARKAAFNARLAQGRKPSRLGLSCFTYEDVEEASVFTPHRWTPSSSLRHSAPRHVGRPTTIALPMQEPGPSSEIVVPGRYTTGGSLSREEWKRRLAAIEDRPVAARWADDEEEGDEESITPPLPPSAGAPEAHSPAAVCEDENQPSGNNKPAMEQEAEDTENVQNGDDRRVSSSSVSTTVEHSRASSVSPRSTPDTSLLISDNEDAESKAATDDESDNFCGGAESALGDPQHSQGEGAAISEVAGIDDMYFGEEHPATYGPTLDAETDADDEAGEELPTFTVRTQASSLPARLDAIEVVMQTATTSSTSHIPPGPVTPPRVARRIPSPTSSLCPSSTSTLVATPESLAPTFIESPSIPTPTPRYRGLDARSNPPVIVLTPTGPLPSGPQPVVHRFPNGAITMTLPGQQLGLVRSPEMHFDRLPASFGNVPVERAPVPPTRILSQEKRPAVRSEDVPEVVGQDAVDASQNGTALPQSQATASRALIPYRRPTRLDTSMLRYFRAWNRLLVMARSNGEHFWQGVLRRTCIENYLDARALERAAVIDGIEEEGVEHGVASVRAMSTVVNDGHDTEEEIVANVVDPNTAQPQVAHVGIGVVVGASPEATMREEPGSSSAQVPSPQPLPVSIGLSAASRPRHDRHRVRFVLSSSSSASRATASPNPPPLGTVRHVLRDARPDQVHPTLEKWPDFNGVHCPCIASPPSTSLPSITCAPTSEVSRFSWTSSDDTPEGESHEETSAGEKTGVDVEDLERLRPVPHLPVFQRTRQDWRHASWKATQRRKLTKRRRPPVQEARGTSTAIGVDITSTATATTSGAQSTSVECPKAGVASSGSATISAFKKASAKTKNLWKKTVQKIKAICKKKN
ncbi:hypothetical protein CLAIMM_00901 [Cladophialophora immunda]|nr:hypothetical protein CLAIMM_00901 [Cladophialophora immunda]